MLPGGAFAILSPMDIKTRNRLILGAALAVVGAVIAYNMYFSLTPPRHADHDHAIAKLDAGGFLWIEGTDGKRRNLVGVPEKVLVLHFFDPESADLSEQQAAAIYAAGAADDPMIDFVFIAQAPSWQGVRSIADSAGIPADRLYLDQEGRTAHLCGVRRIPETLVFDPKGFLAYQARGPVSWRGSTITAQIERAKRGVDEIH
jgi:hypothetical protein